MADLFVNTDRLAEAYYYLSKFSEYENSISDYQQNIKTAFLGCINNQELAALLTKASDCLSRSQERCQAVMKGIDSINSICEWCNEESKALAASVESPSSSQSAIAVSPEVSSAKDFLTGVKTAVGVVGGIKELIKEKGYTQQGLAEKLGMTRVGLTQLVNGKPSYPTLEKIAEALGVEMWELFKSKSEIVEEIAEEKKNTVPCPYCGRDINVSLLKKEE